MQPTVGVVQAGYRSRFGQPAPPVLARYQAARIAVVASPACGARRWQSGSPLAAATCERESRRRYWQDRSPVAAGVEGPPVDEQAPAEVELAF